MYKIILVLCIAYCNAFNIDIPSFVLHRSPQDASMFGFSVALYKNRNHTSVLVGAPKFNTPQERVFHGGAVLRCDANYPGNCVYVPFDITGNKHSIGFQTEEKSNQFFGATLKTSENKDIVVACAPKYIYYTASFNKREPVGKCFVARNGLTDIQEFSPCRNELFGYHRQGSCQAGFDAALTSDGERMFIGAPGAYYWHGEVFGTEFKGQIHSQNLIVKNEYYTTGEGPPQEDDQYLGYSVASGDFNGDGIQDVALGVPKGNYTGKIALYTHDLRWIQNITGNQLGSYFGYCLCVVDFNGDGRDDIVVGSPMYTNFSDREMKIEIGRVDIMLQNDRHQFKSDIHFIGDTHKGRFGLSVASLGDINLDGYEDIAIGAPYGGKDGRGAVYIYHGFGIRSGEEVKEKNLQYAQVLRATDIGDRLLTFGWSLSGGVDIDNNLYPDLLVGAYESDVAVVFRSRPIVNFYNSKLEFVSNNRLLDIKSKNCNVRGRRYTCLDLQFCVTYNGTNVDNEIDLEVTYKLDAKHSDEVRLRFHSNEERSLTERVRYRKDVINCRTHKTFVKNNVNDKLSPITADVEYNLITQRRISRSLTPVLNLGQKLSLKDSIMIKLNCGPENICVPDLQLSINAPDTFVLGQKDMMSIGISVVNRGEDAFKSMVTITEPKGMLYNKFIAHQNTSINLSKEKINGTNYINFEIGNPLPGGEEVSLDVLFQQSPGLLSSEYEFLISTNSTNKEADGNDLNNWKRIVVAGKIDAQMTYYGLSSPEELFYNTSKYHVAYRQHEKDIGPDLIHTYQIVSDGPSEVDELDIVILWPARNLEGKHNLYLMEQPITVGDVACNYVEDVNPLDFQTISAEERSNLLGLDKIDSSRISQATKSSSIYAGFRGQSSSKGYSSGFKNERNYTTSGGTSRVYESTHTSSSGGSFSSSSDKGYSGSSGQGSFAGSSSRGTSGSSGQGLYSGSSGEGSYSGSTRQGSYSGSSGQGSYSGSSGQGSFSDTSRQGTSSSTFNQDINSSGNQRTYSSGSSATGSSGQGSFSSSSGQGTYSGSSRQDYYPGYTNEGYYSGNQKTYSTGLASVGGQKTYSGSYDRSSSPGTGSTSSQGVYTTGSRQHETYQSGSSAYPSSSGKAYSGSFEGTYSSGGQDQYSSGSSSHDISGSIHEETYPYKSESHNTYISGGRTNTVDGSYLSGGSYSSGSNRNADSRQQNVYGSRTNQGVYSSSAQGNYSGAYSPGVLSSGTYSSSSGQDLLLSGSSAGSGGLRTSVLSPDGSSSGTSFSSEGRQTSSSSGGYNRGSERYPSGSGTYSSSSTQSQGSGIHSSGQGTYTSSSGTQSSDSSSQSLGSGSSSGFRHYSSNYGTHETSGGTDDSFVSGSDVSGDRKYQTSYSKSYERTYSSSDGGEPTNRYESSSSYSSSDGENTHPQNRVKRSGEYSDREWYKLTQNCGSSDCIQIQCVARNFASKSDISIILRSRLYMKTLEEDENVSVTTTMVSRARINAQGISDNDVYKVNVKDIRTPLISVDSISEAQSPPWWIILLAILAGLLILLIIILILWKCGYFQRNRPKPTHSEDSVPLNTANGSNGYRRNGHRPAVQQPLFPGDAIL